VCGERREANCGGRERGLRGLAFSAVAYNQ